VPTQEDTWEVTMPTGMGEHLLGGHVSPVEDCYFVPTTRVPSLCRQADPPRLYSQIAQSNSNALMSSR